MSSSEAQLTVNTLTKYVNVQNLGRWMIDFFGLSSSVLLSLRCAPYILRGLRTGLNIETFRCFALSGSSNENLILRKLNVLVRKDMYLTSSPRTRKQYTLDVFAPKSSCIFAASPGFGTGYVLRVLTPFTSLAGFAAVIDVFLGGILIILIEICVQMQVRGAMCK